MDWWKDLFGFAIYLTPTVGLWMSVRWSGLPGVWPIAEGTGLTAEEVVELQENGFVFHREVKNIQGGQASKSDGRVPSAIRPKYRDGKFVKWRAKLTKEFQDCIEKGRILDAQVVQEVILMCGESHIFHVSTEGSRAKGVTYSVTISDFPRCTCEGFQKREAKHLVYVPCKHIYYIFLQVLGLDQNAHEFIHQAALTKVELFQALGSRRTNLPL